MSYHYSSLSLQTEKNFSLFAFGGQFFHSWLIKDHIKYFFMMMLITLQSCSDKTLWLKLNTFLLSIVNDDTTILFKIFSKYFQNISCDEKRVFTMTVITLKNSLFIEFFIEHKSGALSLSEVLSWIPWKKFFLEKLNQLWQCAWQCVSMNDDVFFILNNSISTEVFMNNFPNFPEIKFLEIIFTLTCFYVKVGSQFPWIYDSTIIYIAWKRNQM